MAFAMIYILDIFLNFLIKNVPGQTQQQNSKGIRNKRIAPEIMNGIVINTVSELKEYFFYERIFSMF